MFPTEMYDRDFAVKPVITGDCCDCVWLRVSLCGNKCLPTSLLSYMSHTVKQHYPSLPSTASMTTAQSWVEWREHIVRSSGKGSCLLLKVLGRGEVQGGRTSMAAW